MEHEVRTTRPSPMSNTCWATVERMRSASSARRSPFWSRATSRNSSPPQRTMMSELRLTDFSRSLSCRSTASPAACPAESLIVLKWSTSIIMNARSSISGVSGPSEARW